MARYRPGYVFSWEPGKRHSQCRVVVVEVRTNADGEEWIGCKKLEPFEPVTPGELYWNERDRCDEAQRRWWNRLAYRLRGYPRAEPIYR
jgi:hypothetical protein